LRVRRREKTMGVEPIPQVPQPV